jgi:hypothetical protein
MDADPANWSFPVIAGLTEPFHFHGIREMTLEEVVKNDEYTRIVTRARNRFRLFSILSRNYADWNQYTRSLFTPNEGLTDNELVELDRLQMNFLSSARALLDHFRQHWIQAFRNTSKEKDYDNFIRSVEKKSWAFAFFQDLRNFTQHCGLPTGNYTRTVDINSIVLRVEASSKWLTENYDRWSKSRLTAEKGQLNLLDLIREYYIYLHDHFGNFIASTFAPELLEAHEFYESLAREVHTNNSNAQLRIITGYNQEGNSLRFQFKVPPSDLMDDIGIVIHR